MSFSAYLTLHSLLSVGCMATFIPYRPLPHISSVSFKYIIKSFYRSARRDLPKASKQVGAKTNKLCKEIMSRFVPKTINAWVDSFEILAAFWLKTNT